MAGDHGWSLIHRTRGRVRYRVPRVRADPTYASDVAECLSAETGVESVRVTPACASVAIRFDPERTSPARMALALRTVGRAGTPRRYAPPSPETLPLVAGLASVALAVFGAPAGIAGAALAVGALPIVVRAVRGLVDERAVTVDALDATAVGILALRGDLATSALSVSLIAGGELIRGMTARRSRRAAVELLARGDETVWIVRDGVDVRTGANALRPGDVLIAHTGDRIVADGRIVRGEALVDEHALTGESEPVAKRVGDTAYAATFVSAGVLRIAVEQVAERTRAGRIVRLLEEAPEPDTRLTDEARRVGDRLALPTLALGGAVFAATGDAARAAAVVIFDFATGIRVSAPTTILATMTRAARNDVLIKSGRAIEKLARVDAIVFDKTGTLTRGAPAVIRVRGASGADDATILRWAASAERSLAHPAARAIVEAAHAAGAVFGERTAARVVPGLGVAAVVDGHTVRVGRPELMREAGITADDDGDDGVSVAHVAVDDRYLGAISYSDEVRPEAATLCASLRERGIFRLVIVSGDRRGVVSHLAHEVGITEHVGAVFPERKAEIVRELQQAGHVVAVVGDGINDSPALAYADVSVAVRDGTDLARETADVVLHGSLDGLLVAIDRSRDAMSLLRQNIALAVGPNLAGMALASAGALGPAAATAINNGSAIAAGLNGLRPLAAPIVGRRHAQRSLERRLGRTNAAERVDDRIANAVAG